MCRGIVVVNFTVNFTAKELIIIVVNFTAKEGIKFKKWNRRLLKFPSKRVVWSKISVSWRNHTESMSIFMCWPMFNLVLSFTGEGVEKNSTFENLLLVSTMLFHLFFVFCPPMYLSPWHASNIAGGLPALATAEQNRWLPRWHLSYWRGVIFKQESQHPQARWISNIRGRNDRGSIIT